LDTAQLAECLAEDAEALALAALAALRSAAG
jgi:hypothetical protein